MRLAQGPSLPLLLGTVAAGYERQEGQMVAWRLLQEDPSGSILPTCPGGPESERRLRPPPSKGLFLSGSHKSHLPSWASSAGINIIKGMFSLLPGFTMCWERKNKSFIPTRMIDWRQSFLSKTRKFPLDFQKGRRAKVRQAGTRGHEVWSLGVVRKAEGGQRA